jgi:transcriptional regulator with XRE-family HTH domain
LSDIGKKFIDLRNALGLNQKEFAKETRLSQGRLSEIERGKNNPSFETLKQIKLKYNLNMNYFFDENSEIGYYLNSDNGYSSKDLVHNTELSNSEKELLHNYSLLPSKEQGRVEQFTMDLMKLSIQNEQDTKGKLSQSPNGREKEADVKMA